MKFKRIGLRSWTEFTFSHVSSKFAPNHVVFCLWRFGFVNLQMQLKPRGNDLQFRWELHAETPTLLQRDVWHLCPSFQNNSKMSKVYEKQSHFFYGQNWTLNNNAQIKLRQKRGICFQNEILQRNRHPLIKF